MVCPKCQKEYHYDFDFNFCPDCGERLIASPDKKSSRILKKILYVVLIIYVLLNIVGIVGLLLIEAITIYLTLSGSL